jgi:hypothetical protein
MPEKGHRENLHREEPSAPRKGVRAHRSKETHRATADDNALRREVLAAIEELKDGKAVAAYERLKRAIQR